MVNSLRKKIVIAPKPVMIGPVTKLVKRNKKLSKKFDDEVMSTNFDVIVIFFNL